MEITIKGDPKEIAALVFEIQERQKRKEWDDPQHADIWRDGLGNIVSTNHGAIGG